MEATFFAASILILLFSVIIHEVAHGLAALYYGDTTAQRAGRLTLNPLPHIDPIGTLLLPLLLVISGSPVLFGWAKPVPINPFNFSNIKKGELGTALAGVAANFLLAFLGALIFHLTGAWTDSVVKSILVFTIDINLILAIFNFLPIPPLDGSKVLMALLPPYQAAKFAQLERYGFFILMFLWLVPVGGSSILGIILGILTGFFHTLLGV
jgi:Zn-dependent protease